MHPVDDLRPLRVAGAGMQAQRLLADDAVQHDPIGRVLQGRAHSGQAAGVVGVAVTAAGFHRGYRLVGLFEQQCADLGAVGLGEVGDVELQRGAGQRADGRAVQVRDLGHAELLADQKTLAGIEIDRDLIEAELHRSRKRQCAVADQHVDLARLQHREARRGGGRHEADLFPVAQHRGGDGAAIADIQPLPTAGVVLRGKAGHADIDAAIQLAALFDRLHGDPWPTGAGWGGGLCASVTAERDHGRKREHSQFRSQHHRCRLSQHYLAPCLYAERRRLAFRNGKLAELSHWRKRCCAVAKRCMRRTGRAWLFAMSDTIYRRPNTAHAAKSHQGISCHILMSCY